VMAGSKAVWYDEQHELKRPCISVLIYCICLGAWQGRSHPQRYCL
jgi:hypothetical protein